MSWWQIQGAQTTMSVTRCHDDRYKVLTRRCRSHDVRYKVLTRRCRSHDVMMTDTRCSNDDVGQTMSWWQIQSANTTMSVTWCHDDRYKVITRRCRSHDVRYKVLTRRCRSHDVMMTDTRCSNDDVGQTMSWWQIQNANTTMSVTWCHDDR